MDCGKLYGAQLDLVNFPRRFCVPVALRLRNRKKCLGDIFFAEQMNERIGEANLESLQERAMRWSPKAAQGNSPKMTARRISFSTPLDLTQAVVCASSGTADIDCSDKGASCPPLQSLERARTVSILGKDPLSTSFWGYLTAAIATAAAAAALFFFYKPAAIVLTAGASWLFCSSAFMLLSHHTQESESFSAKAIRWTRAMIFEINSGVLAAFLFPATLFDHYHEPKGDLRGRPILMINGYLSFGSTWHYLKNRLAEAGFGPIYTMNIGSFDSISEYAAQVRTQVKKIQNETGRKDLTFICHSKGGLVGSYYATRLAAADGVQVADMITIGSPLAGTPIAKYSIGLDAKEMRPDHPFHAGLRQEIAKHPEIRFSNIASETDEFVPLKSALLDGDNARQRVFRDLGHLELIFSSKTADQILLWLKA